MFRELSAPINIQWELTHWCNLKCIHCYNYWRNENNPIYQERYLSKILQEKIVEEIIKNKVFHVTITGGEPLSVLLEYVDSLKKLSDSGISISLNSNLTLASKENIKILKDLNIKSVLVSLISGNIEINNQLTQSSVSYNKTIEGIKLFCSNDITVAINMVVTKKNIKTIRETAQLAKNLGVKAFCATKSANPFNCPDFSDYELSSKDFEFMLEELAWIKSNLNIIVDSLEHYPACSFTSDITHTLLGKRNCSAGKTGCTIGFDMQVRPCSHARLTYGSISDGLKNCWKKMYEWREGAFVPEICKKQCKEYPVRCGGGCRILSFLKKNTMNESDPYCKQRKPTTKRLNSKRESMNGSLKVALSDLINLREEPFGFIVYIDSDRWTPVDVKLGNLIQKNKIIEVKEISSIYGISDEEAKKTLQYLVSKQIASPM